jgi:hypothetical protein
VALVQRTPRVATFSGKRQQLFKKFWLAFLPNLLGSHNESSGSRMPKVCLMPIFFFLKKSGNLWNQTRMIKCAS